MTRVSLIRGIRVSVVHFSHLASRRVALAVKDFLTTDYMDIADGIIRG